MAEHVTVKELLKDINDGLSQNNGVARKSASRKDEIKVMQAMLNDTSYEVDVYNKDGVESTYNPAKDFRNMCSNIISKSAKIPFAEATNLVDKYEVTKSDASSMVNISKEFVNTYIHSGRKLPLGGREFSDVSLEIKEVEQKETGFPKKIGVDPSGKAIYKTESITIPSHTGVKASSPCPTWRRAK